MEDIIRPAVETDAPRIAEIYNDAIEHGTATFDTQPKSVEDRILWLQAHQNDGIVLVTESKGILVAWAAVSPWSNRRAYAVTGEISAYVHRDFQGQGLGKRLSSQLIQAAIDRGYHTLLARITEGNTHSERMYASLGFVNTGTLKEVGKKFGRTLDVHMYQRLLKSDLHRSFSKAPWEAKAGYCRAIRAKNHIYVSGTVPIDEHGNTHAPNDAYAQACRCFERIKEALKEHRAGLKDVIRTRMFVTDIQRWEEFGRAHRTYFGSHPPATTMVEVKALIDPDMLIEVEADAWIVSR